MRSCNRLPLPAFLYRDAAQAALAYLPGHLFEFEYQPADHRPKAEQEASPQPTSDGPQPSIDEQSLVWLDVAQLADAGQLEDALRLCESMPPSDHPDRYLVLGSILSGLERWNDARDALRKAVYLQPRHEEALLQLAVLELRLGNTQQAERYQTRAAEIHAEQEERESSE